MLSAIIICTFQCMIEVWFNVMKDGKRGMTNTNCPYHIHFRTFYLKVNILGRTWSWELYKVQCTSISEYTRELLRSELFLLISTWSFLSLQSTKTVKANTAKVMIKACAVIAILGLMHRGPRGPCRTVHPINHHTADSQGALSNLSLYNLTYFIQIIYIEFHLYNINIHLA